MCAGLVFGSGCAGLPETLDQELHALSLQVAADVDAAVDRILDEILTLVFGEVPDEAVLRLVGAAVGWGFAEYRVGRDLDRVLLINATGGVSAATGLGAVAALPAYSAAPAGTCSRRSARVSPVPATSSGAIQPTTTRPRRDPGCSGRCVRSNWSCPERCAGASRRSSSPWAPC